VHLGCQLVASSRLCATSDCTMSTIPRRKANSNSFNGDIVIQPIEITAVSREGSPNPVANLSSNTNYVLGTGNIVHNHNHNTNYVLNAGIHMDSVRTMSDHAL